MAGLARRHAAEREALARVLGRLDKGCANLQEFMEVLVACRDFGSVDPVPHLIEALREYLAEEPA
ncbi:MAG: hypothetical protein H6948_01020 [Zoogloeaceae bacterium]|nr:hypothetical protein [Zoogloeaceae bacterium]